MVFAFRTVFGLNLISEVGLETFREVINLFGATLYTLYFLMLKVEANILKPSIS